MQQVVAQIPWGHNIVLMDKVADLDERRWYVEKTAENGWPRNVLVHQIESGLYQRQVLANKVSNFEHRLPSPQSELAEQALLLCKSKDNLVAEYSLKDISKPIGVSEYKVTSSLPDDLEKQLPSVEDIQKRIR